MEDVVRKLCILLCAVSLACAAGPLFAQEATVDAEAAAAKKKATDTRKK
jgi:hypothetical protein